jgi:hypothetical protein
LEPSSHPTAAHTHNGLPSPSLLLQLNSREVCIYRSSLDATSSLTVQIPWDGGSGCSPAGCRRNRGVQRTNLLRDCTRWCTRICRPWKPTICCPRAMESTAAGCFYNNPAPFAELCGHALAIQVGKSNNCVPKDSFKLQLRCKYPFKLVSVRRSFSCVSEEWHGASSIYSGHPRVGPCGFIAGRARFAAGAGPVPGFSSAMAGSQQACPSWGRPCPTASPVS